MENIAGVLLTGGKSGRFGKDKAFAVYQDMFFYQQMVNKMHPYVQHIYVVKREDQWIDSADKKVTLLTDVPKFKGNGPLAGIYTAMQESSAEWFLVLPVDTPLLSTSVIAELMEYLDSGADAIIPRTIDHIHPLTALYHRQSKELMEGQLLEGKRSLRRLLDKLKVCYADYTEEAEYFFANINTREQYNQFINGLE